MALENTSLYESSVQHAAELDERSQRLALLNRFSASLGGLLDANQVLSLTAEEMRHAFGAERAAGVSLLSGQPTWILSSPAAERRLPLVLPDVPLISRLKESLGIFVAENADAEPELAPLVELVGKGSKAVLAMPLAIGQELLAVLFIMNPAAGTFSSAEMELGRTIANQASIALQNARLYQSTVRSAEQLTVLNQSSAEIGTSLDPEEIYASIQRAVERLMPVDSFMITLLDDETQEADAVFLTDRSKRLAGRRVSLGRGLGSRVISSGESETKPKDA